MPGRDEGGPGKGTTRRPRRRKRPTIAEARQQFAADGDVESLWQVLVRTCPGMLDREEVFRLLLQAGEVASRDPLRFIDDLFRRMLALSGHLVLRGHFFLRRQLAVHDRNNRDHFFSYLPRGTEQLLAGLRELERHTAELAERYARTMRLWQLRSRRPAGATPKTVGPGRQVTAAIEVGGEPERDDRGTLGGGPGEDPCERGLSGNSGRDVLEARAGADRVPGPLPGFATGAGDAEEHLHRGPPRAGEAGPGAAPGGP
jgi:hypothetical protein